MIEIGYGAGAIADYPWHLDGSRPWSDKDRENAELCLSSLDGLGVRLIDTANRYGNGKSEELVGKFIDESGWRGRVVTKIELSKDREEMDRALNESLARLRMKKVDILLFHNPDLGARKLLYDGAAWLRDIIEIGKAVSVGVSSEPNWSLEALYGNCDWLSAIEFPLSVSDQRAKRDMRFLYHRHDLTRIANRVLGGPLARERDLESSIDFITSCDGFIDYALIGTVNPEHLAECVGYANAGRKLGRS